MLDLVYTLDSLLITEDDWAMEGIGEAIKSIPGKIVELIKRFIGWLGEKFKAIKAWFARLLHRNKRDDSGEEEEEDRSSNSGSDEDLDRLRKQAALALKAPASAPSPKQLPGSRPLLSAPKQNSPTGGSGALSVIPSIINKETGKEVNTKNELVRVIQLAQAEPEKTKKVYTVSKYGISRSVSRKADETIKADLRAAKGWVNDINQWQREATTATKLSEQILRQVSRDLHVIITTKNKRATYSGYHPALYRLDKMSSTATVDDVRDAKNMTDVEMKAGIAKAKEYMEKYNTLEDKTNALNEKILNKHINITMLSLKDLELVSKIFNEFVEDDIKFWQNRLQESEKVLANANKQRDGNRRTQYMQAFLTVYQKAIHINSNLINTATKVIGMTNRKKED